MKRQPVICLLAFLIFLTLFCTSRAEVEVSTLKKWTTEGTPIDVAVSLNGGRIYVLTDEREILVYSPTGSLYDKFSVDQSIDGISMGAKDDLLVSPQSSRYWDSITQIVFLSIGVIIYNLQCQTSSPYHEIVNVSTRKINALLISLLLSLSYNL